MPPQSYSRGGNTAVQLPMSGYAKLLLFYIKSLEPVDLHMLKFEML